jgi:hypothetical protein
MVLLRGLDEGGECGMRSAFSYKAGAMARGYAGDLRCGDANGKESMKSAVPRLPRHGDGQPALPFSWSSLSCRASPQRWETLPASSPDRDVRPGQLSLHHETLPGLQFCTHRNG